MQERNDMKKPKACWRGQYTTPGAYFYRRPDGSYWAYYPLDSPLAAGQHIPLSVNDNDRNNWRQAGWWQSDAQ
jgi:hypothetical protein